MLFKYRNSFWDGKETLWEKKKMLVTKENAGYRDCVVKG